MCPGLGEADFYARIRFRITDASIRYIRIFANDDATLYVNGRAVIGEQDPIGAERNDDFPDASTTYADQTVEWPFQVTPTSSVFPIGDPRGESFEIEWVNRRDGEGNGDGSSNRYFLSLEKYDPASGSFTPFAAMPGAFAVVGAEFWGGQGKGNRCGDSTEVQLRPVLEGSRPYLLPALAAHYHPIATPPGYAGDFTVAVRDDRLTHTEASASLLAVTGTACNHPPGPGVEWRGPLEETSPTTQALRVHADGSGGPALVGGDPAVILVTPKRTIHPEAPVRWRPFGTFGSVHYTTLSYWPDRFDRGQFGTPPNDSYEAATLLPSEPSGDTFVAFEGDTARHHDLTVNDLTLHVPEDIDHFWVDLPEAGPDCEVDLPECVGLEGAANGVLSIQALGPLALVEYDEAGRAVRRFDDGYIEVTCPREYGFTRFRFAVENLSDSALGYSLRVRYTVPDAEVARAMSRFCEHAHDEPGGTREDDSFRVLDPIPRLGEGFIFGANCNTIICQPFKHDFLLFRWGQAKTLSVELTADPGAPLDLDLLDERFLPVASATTLLPDGGGAGDTGVRMLIAESLPSGWYLLRLTGSVFGVPYRLRFVDEATGPSFRRGDANGDGRTDISDAVRILGYLFLGEAAPSCRKSADSDDSGGLDISDAIYLLAHLFLGGPALPAPADACGMDPTTDPLECASSPSCPG